MSADLEFGLDRAPFPDGGQNPISASEWDAVVSFEAGRAGDFFPRGRLCNVMTSSFYVNIAAAHDSVWIDCIWFIS